MTFGRQWRVGAATLIKARTRGDHPRKPWLAVGLGDGTPNNKPSAALYIGVGSPKARSSARL